MDRIVPETLEEDGEPPVIFLVSTIKLPFNGGLLELRFCSRIYFYNSVIKVFKIKLI